MSVQINDNDNRVIVTVRHSILIDDYSESPDIQCITALQCPHRVEPTFCLLTTYYQTMADNNYSPTQCL